MRTLIMVFFGACVAVATAARAISPGSAPTTPAIAANTEPFVASIKVAPDPSPAVTPHAEIRDRLHDFGTVEPLRDHRYTFVILNTGTAPLTMSHAESTCKCLKVEVLDKTVEPGGTGRVVVVWAAKLSQDVFRQRATITTNDPSQPTIDLIVEGRALLTLAADPPELVAPRIKPTHPGHVYTTIISQVWDQFTIDHVESSLKGAVWSISPAETGELERLGAKSGWRLAVTLPADMPSGPFRGSLRFVARPNLKDGDDGSEFSQTPLEREIPIEGRVLRRLAIYGEGITPRGAIRIGHVDQDTGYEGRFLVKVNDVEKRLEITDETVSPSFVEVQMVPYQEINKPGIYQLQVHIPPSSMAGVYQGEKHGRLSLEFSHPRIKVMDLDLEFVITSREQSHLGHVSPSRPAGL